MHGGLSESRSGLFPHLVHVRKGAVLTTGDTPGSSVSIVLNPNGVFAVAPGGSVELAVDGIIKDQHGATVGALLVVADRAVAAWERCLVGAGVVLPTKPV